MKADEPLIIYHGVLFNVKLLQNLIQFERIEHILESFQELISSLLFILHLFL